VEILTAIAIIAILVTMAVLAFKHSGSGPKMQTTKTMLQNLRGMYAEFEGTGGRTKDILRWYENPAGTPAPLPVSNQVFDPDNIHLYIPDPKSNPAPGSAMYELYVTAYKVMPKLRSVPANKSVLDSMPVDHVYPRAWLPTKSYQVGERVQSANGFFICTSAYSAGGSTAAKPPEQDGGHWGVDDPNLLILDAWGSPIIFVPPAGAVNMQEGGATRVVGGSGNTAPKQAPDQKGYFMSAGEDRNMAAGDDNVTSFENK
jgi:hypothetical protein